MDFQRRKDFAELPACKVICQFHHQPLGFFNWSKECVHMPSPMETTFVYLVSTTQEMFKQKVDWPSTTGKSSLTIAPRLLGIAAVSQVRITKAERPTFASDIRPILESSCQPCHFQGGQMYEKLPFE